MADREAISITPGNQVLTFSSMEKAKVILMSKYHKYIADSPAMLARIYEIEDLILVVRANGGDYNLLRKMQRHSSKEELCEKLWPELVLIGRRTSTTVFGKGRPRLAKSLDEQYVFCSYEPFNDRESDLVYIKMPPQCKILVDLLVEHVGREGIRLSYWYDILIRHKEMLATRQDPLKVFTFYKPRLLKQGFLNIK